MACSFQHKKDQLVLICQGEELADPTVDDIVDKKVRNHATQTICNFIHIYHATTFTWWLLLAWWMTTSGSILGQKVRICCLHRWRWAPDDIILYAILHINCNVILICTSFIHLLSNTASGLWADLSVTTGCQWYTAWAARYTANKISCKVCKQKCEQLLQVPCCIESYNKQASVPRHRVSM